MATITVTEILGSDNIAGSRVTINDNFKRVVNGINTLETYLDTSFTPGAFLNVGSALIKKYTRPITDQIFTCEATGLFNGNLNVGQDLGVSRDLTTSRNFTVSGTVTLDGTAGATTMFSTAIPIETNASVINKQLYFSTPSNSLTIDPQSLLPTSNTNREIVPTSSFKKVSVIRLDYRTYSGTAPNHCDTIVLPLVTNANVGNGQIITFIVEYVSTVNDAEFKISSTNLDPCYTSDIILNDGVNSDDPTFRKSSITLFADSGGWRVLHTTGSVLVP